MRLDAVHTLRATPRHHASGVPGGAAARHAARETAQRELLPHGGAPGALAVAAICHSRRALPPPKKKSGPLPDASLSVALRGGRG